MLALGSDAAHFHGTGTGRDSYIIHDNGGLYTARGLAEQSARFETSFRQWNPSPSPEPQQSPWRPTPSPQQVKKAREQRKLTSRLTQLPHRLAVAQARNKQRIQDSRSGYTDPPEPHLVNSLPAIEAPRRHRLQAPVARHMSHSMPTLQRQAQHRLHSRRHWTERNRRRARRIQQRLAQTTHREQYDLYGHGRRHGMKARVRASALNKMGRHVLPAMPSSVGQAHAEHSSSAQHGQRKVAVGARGKEAVPGLQMEVVESLRASMQEASYVAAEETGTEMHASATKETKEVSVWFGENNTVHYE